MPNKRVEDGQQEIANWIEKWDKRIANWIKEGQIDEEIAPILKAYEGNVEGKEEAKLLDLTAMPEPYVGDPTREVDAVMLMLNPGKSGSVQRREDGIGRPEGELVKVVRESTYHDVARDYLSLPTTKMKAKEQTTKAWWEGRSQWASRLLGEGNTPCSIVGIDLIPWHSKKWGSVESNPIVLSWINENVLRPAAIMSMKSKLTIKSKIGIPIVLAIGAQHKYCLKGLGYKLLREISEKNHVRDLPPWPVRSNAELVHRNIRLYVAEDESLAVLQTDARGGFKPPQKEFDPIVREMLCLSNKINEVIYTFA